MLETLRRQVGTQISLSDWLAVDQAMIDRFADLTGDHQWIHVDPARAATGPFGTTVAQGFLTLSLVARLTGDTWLDQPNVAGGLNYGLDRLRFLSPVKAGARIRCRVRMLAAEAKGAGRTLVTNEVTMEIEGEARPAFVATTLVMILSDL